MKPFIKYNWPSALWAAFILYLCLLPGKDLPSISLWEADKAVHFSVYLVLAILTYYGWCRQNAVAWLRRQTLLKLVLITFSYGFLVEILQELLTTDRQFDILDAGANGAGAIAGSLIGWKLVKR